MRLYQTEFGEWAGTQADARALTGTWQQVEVPTDKPKLLAFLNEHRVGQPVVPAKFLDDEPSEAPAPEDPQPHREALFDVQQIDICERFILDKATPAQIEQLFAALGARFHEMRKAAQD